MKTSYLFLLFILFLFVSCEQHIEIKGETEPAHPSPWITLKSGAIVEKRGDRYIWGGDMVLTQRQLELLDRTGNIFESDNTKSFGIDFSSQSTNNKWSMVRFTYGANLTSRLHISIFFALSEIESQTNVRFYNATGLPTIDPITGFVYPYIEFVEADVNSSKVGQIGGRQEIELLDYEPYYVVVHEICHALGMMHEHQRPDRDSYVKVNTANLKPNGVKAFQKIPSNYVVSYDYDFNSIMGYPSMAISDTTMVYDLNMPMYTKLNDSLIDMAIQLSDLDRMWINSYHLPRIARSDTYVELATTVFAPDNSVLSPSDRLTLQASLNNGNPTPPTNGRLYNDLSMFLPLSIGGPNVISTGTPTTFAVNHWNIGFSWNKSSNLSLSDSGSSVSVTGNSNGAGWVSIMYNGAELKRHHVFVGPPVDLAVTGPINQNAGSSFTFDALTASQLTSLTWSIEPTTGVSFPQFGQGSGYCQIYFSEFSANTTFLVKATATNQIGSVMASHYINIGSYFGEYK